MDDTISVRDYSQPCEHGYLWPHWIETTKGKWWQQPDCFGGKKMILRRLPDGLLMEVEAVDDGERSRP